MPIHASVQKVTFSEAQDAIYPALLANVPVMLIGDPGVGKSALARLVADKLGRNLQTLIGSTLDPTDIGGMPVVRIDGKGIDRIPLTAIKKLCTDPGILFLDEIACAPPAVQAAMLRLILERVAGDLELHPETRVLAATNPPEQSPGGSDLSAPLIGRVMLLHLRPSHDEVLEFFEGLGDGDNSSFGQALRAESRDFAATARVAADLLEIDIPQDANGGNRPWGAPRAWERVVRARAAAVSNGINSKKTLKYVTAGSVGTHLAVTYAAIQDIRTKLPSIEDIATDPAGVKVPEDAKHQIGAVGLLARVAERDPWAAFVYADRLRPELRVACGKMLMKRAKEAEGGESPHKEAGRKARLDILKSIPRSRT